MSKPDWNKAPYGAEWWAPETENYVGGFYKKDESGVWQFSASRSSGWIYVEIPSTYRKKMMERRP